MIIIQRKLKNRTYVLQNIEKGSDVYKRQTQVTVEYDNGKPSRLDAVVLSTQHDPDITQEQIHEDIKREVFDKILPTDMVDDETKFFINPTGRFVIGGPHGDAGLTGRKIIVDTYGGYARHGGGAFSGKDCTCLLYTSGLRQMDAKSGTDDT